MSSNQPPERICLKQVERDGHLQWVEASGVNGEPEYQLISGPARENALALHTCEKCGHKAVLLVVAPTKLSDDVEHDRRVPFEQPCTHRFTHCDNCGEPLETALIRAPPAAAPATSWEDDAAFMVWLRANVEDWRLEFSGHLEGLWAAFKAGQGAQP